jgi:hypothetical protein
MANVSMHEKAIVLERSIQNDLKAIAEIFEAIGTSPVTAGTPEADLIEKFLNFLQSLQ